MTTDYPDGTDKGGFRSEEAADAMKALAEAVDEETRVCAF